MTDEELLSRIAHGDKRALRELYERFKARVFNTALSYLHDVEEAEELTQDVFLEVFRSASSFEGNAKPSTWIYRIVVNRSLDRLKYRARKKRSATILRMFGASGELVHDVPEFDHPGVLIENKESAKILFKAIDELPLQQRSAYLLAFVEELPQQEIAEIMKLSVKAVESLLQRAKGNLRLSLKSYYPERRK